MRAFFLIPGDLSRKTGGYGYDRRIIADAAAYGVTLEPVALPGGFPFPEAAELTATQAIVKAMPSGVPLLIDGLAYGAFDATLLGVLRGPVIALVHHPLAYENGLAPAVAAGLKASETAALARAAAVIVTSAPTKAVLVSDFSVPADKIHVALPGTEQASFAQGSRETGPVLLGVGSLTPRKAWSVLIDALAQCKDRAWRMVIAGDGPERDALQRQIASSGLGARVELKGEVSEDELAQLYDSADLFVMPSLYEGFGMALTEALAHGLPAIASDGVVALHHLPENSVTRVRAGDAIDLSGALLRALDPQHRAIMGEHARMAAAHLPRWNEAARIVTDTIRSIAS